MGPSSSDNPFSAPSVTTPCSELLPQVIPPQRRPHGYSHGPSGTTFSHQASPSSRWLCLCKRGLSLVTPPHLLSTERVVLGFVTLPLPGHMQDGTGIQVHTHTASWRDSFQENRTKDEVTPRQEWVREGARWQGRPALALGATICL